LLGLGLDDHCNVLGLVALTVLRPRQFTTTVGTTVILSLNSPSFILARDVRNRFFLFRFIKVHKVLTLTAKKRDQRGSVFEEKSNLVRNEFGSVQFKKRGSVRL